MEDVKVIEAIRAGDVVLVKVYCKGCGDELLTSPDTIKCPCGHTESNYYLDLDDVYKRNLVPLTKKTERKRISKKIVLSLLRLQNNTCAYCDCDLSTIEYHVDHVKPIVLGGTNNFNNLAISCSTCNLIASGKGFIDLIAKRLYIQFKRFNKKIPR